MTNNSHAQDKFDAFVNSREVPTTDGVPGRLVSHHGWCYVAQRMTAEHWDTPDDAGNWLLAPYYRNTRVPSHPNVIDLRGRAPIFVQEMAELILHITHENIGTIMEPIYLPENHAKAHVLGARVLCVGDLDQKDAVLLARRIGKWHLSPFISCSFSTRSVAREGRPDVLDSLFDGCEPLCPARPFMFRCFPNLAKLLEFAWGEGLSVDGFEPENLHKRASLLLDALKSIYSSTGFTESPAHRDICTEIIAANFWADTGDMRHSVDFAQRVCPQMFTI